MQTVAYTQTSASLKENWLQCIKNGIKNNLKEVGKGWFNLAEKRREVYDISKLKKFMGIFNATNNLGIVFNCS